MSNKAISGRKVKTDYIDVFAHLFLILFSICILYPMLNVVAKSFSSSGPLTRNEVTIFPIGFTLESYKYFAEHVRFVGAFFNGIWYTVEGVAANLFFTALMAYPLSKHRLIGRTFVMRLVVFSMYFGGGLIPVFMLITGMGLGNSEWSWILGALISASNLIVTINGFRSIPESLYEAAYLDGASEFQVFFKIALPLAKATLASIGLFYFINHWNQWYAPMLYLDDPAKFPLQLFMRSVLITGDEFAQDTDFNQNITPTGVKNALIGLSMIPVMVVYPFVQKYFVKGVMMGSVKG